jgi:hypothetical protein
MDQAEALSKYRAYVKGNPSEKDAARKSFFDTFGVDPERPLFSGDVRPKTAGTSGEVSKRAASRLRGIGVEQHAATKEAEIGKATGEAISTIGKATVLGGAALASGGLATPYAITQMGVAGVGAAAIGEVLKKGAGSDDLPKSAKGLALKMGVEGLLSASGEAGIRAIGQGLKLVGKEVWPALVMRSSAKAQNGQNALKRVQQNSLDQLRDFVRGKGNPTVNIGDDIVQFFGTLRKRATGSSESFKTNMKPVFAKLWKAAERTDGSLENQPLDALLEIKSDLSYVTYKSRGMNTDEFKALEDLTTSVDAKVTNKLNSLGSGAAKKIYSNYKAFTEQIKRDDGALAIAETGLKKVLGKASGYVPGLDATLDGLIRGHAAPWLLEHLFTAEKTAALVKKAINMEAIGQHGAAQTAFDAAVNTSGVGSLLKDYFSPEKRKIASQALMPAPQEAPNAAPQRP